MTDERAENEMTNDQESNDTTEAARFGAPGPGHWEIDRSHFPGGTTPICQWLMTEAMPAGMARVFEELGVPAETLSCAFVNGFFYTRLRPLIAPDKPPAKLPPLPILKLATRLHPKFRKREKAAEKTLRERPWRSVIEQWHSTMRPEIEAANLALQDVDPSGLDDHGLVHHIEDLLAHVRRNLELHFWLHGYDLGPLGLMVFDCQRWGIAPGDVLAALAGASPSTSAPGLALKEIRSAVREHLASGGTRPQSLAELRDVSPDVAARLDEYLRYKGTLLFSRYDLDGITLNDAPAVVLATACEGLDHEPIHDAESIAASLRSRVPEAERPLFDERLAEARAALDLRDDNGPTTGEWPLGLLRRGLLEAGRRLTESGRAHSPEHALELGPVEVVTLLHDGVGPSADQLAERAAHRAAQAKLDPPRSLGAAEPVPPLEVLPPALRMMVGTVNAVLTQMGFTNADPSARAEPLRGSGIGTVSYRGVARRAGSSEEAIAMMEPGDVLVVRFTTPAYNVVLSLAGAVVTAEGGPMSHAAVLARELGIPAIVGVPGALTHIPDGATVEVDPAAGAVRILTPA